MKSSSFFFSGYFTFRSYLLFLLPEKFFVAQSSVLFRIQKNSSLKEQTFWSGFCFFVHDVWNYHMNERCFIWNVASEFNLCMTNSTYFKTLRVMISWSSRCSAGTLIWLASSFITWYSWNTHVLEKPGLYYNCRLKNSSANDISQSCCENWQQVENWTTCFRFSLQLTKRLPFFSLNPNPALDLRNFAVPYTNPTSHPPNPLI